MITGNLQFCMGFDAHRQIVLRALATKGLLKPESQEALTTSKVSKAKPLKARINHGRWLVDCECGGAEFAFDEGLFLCESCWNKAHKHQLRKIAFPQKRQQIELVLLPRPEPNRNWYPGETVTQLEAENKAHKEALV